MDGADGRTGNISARLELLLRTRHSVSNGNHVVAADRSRPWAGGGGAQVDTTRKRKNAKVITYARPARLTCTLTPQRRSDGGKRSGRGGVVNQQAAEATSLPSRQEFKFGGLQVHSS